MSIFSRLLKVVLVLALILLFVFPILSYFTGYRIYRDVSYAQNEQNVMDVYLPHSAKNREASGCVIFIHGGSWSGGDKSEEAAKCRLLASQGYVAATINYTLWSEENADVYHVSTVLDEIDAALLKLVHFALEHDVKIDKAATSGYSAGAHLSMLYSFSRAESAPVDIVFTSNMAGPADISTRVWGEDMTIRVGRRLTGAEITADILTAPEVQALLSSISPVSYISESTPPSIIMHGGKDDIVPVGNAESLIAAFTANSVPYEYVFLKDSNHMLVHNPLKRLTYYKLFLDYCDKYL